MPHDWSTRRPLTKEQMEDKLKKFMLHFDLKQTPSIDFFKKNSGVLGFDYQRAIKFYGSWHNFLKVCGVKNTRWKYIPTKEELEKNFLMLVARFGRVPKRDEFVSNSRSYGYSISAIRKFYGSWNNFVSGMGFQLCHPHFAPSRSFMLDSFKKFYKELGFLPDYKLVGRNSRKLGFSTGVIESVFGSYNNFVREAGFIPNKPGVSAERIRSLLLSLYPDLKCEVGKEFPWLRSPVTGCVFRCDFLIPSFDLFIEFDDESHFELNFYIRKGIGLEEANKRFEERKINDLLKGKLIVENGYRLLRIKYTESWRTKKYLCARVKEFLCQSL